MVEETKTLGGLTGAAPPPDQNAAAKPDNADQTAEGAPNGNVTQNQQGSKVDTQPVIDEAAAIRAVDYGVTAGDTGEEIWSSHPIPRFKIGRFVFENSVLRLTDSKDKQDFAKIYEALTPRDKLTVKRLDMAAVDRIVQERSAMTQMFDSSVGRDAMERLRGEIPTIGREDISHAARPQQDQNVPSQPGPSVDPEGASGIDQGPHTAPGA